MLKHEDCAQDGAPDGGRRSALMALGALCGLALGGDVLAAVAGPKAGPGKGKAAGAAPRLLSRDQLALTGVLADLIIPRTETPGALAAGAHHTIDHLLKVCTLPPAQDAFKAGLARIDAVAQGGSGKRFVQLPKARQIALLQALDTGAAPFNQDDGRFFRQLKGYVAFAYYTSEVGATKELAYLPVPGGYTADVKVTPSTRTWAL